jgi:hypothetical protein
MVRIVRTAVFVLAVLACLAGCNLGVGIFPDRLMSYEAYADLERFIDRDHIGDYRFQIIRSSSTGEEFLVLANDDGSRDDDCVVIFNADLGVLGHFAMDQLDAMDPANPYGGRGAMVDAEGKIVVGNRRFTVSARGVKYASTPPVHLHNYGLAIPEAANPNFSNIRAWSDAVSVFFDCTAYPVGWPDSPATQIPTPKFGAGTWGHLDGVWLLDSEVMLLADRDGMSPQIHLLSRPDFAALNLCDPLCYPVANVPSPGNLWWETLGYTDEGYAVFKEDTNEYILFDKAVPLPLAASLTIPYENRPWNQRHLYGRTSGWYVMDMKEMSIERRKWWWK